MRELVIFDRVTYSYEEERQPALQNISLTIQQNELVAIIGPNGCGKSTLCQLLNGSFLSQMGGEYQGKISLNGYQVQQSSGGAAPLAGQIGIVFQDADAQLVMGMVEDELAFGPENLRVAPAEIKQRIERVVQDLGISELRCNHVHELSGGQKQKVAIASVLTMDSPLIILDDVTANLDPSSKQSLLGLMDKLHEQGFTLLVTAARTGGIPQRTTRVVRMEEGRIVYDGPPRQEDCQSIAAPNSLPSSEHSYSGLPALVDVRGLSYAYPNGAQPLTDISFKIYPGDFMAVTGPNGSGKTTLSKLLMGLLPAPQGAIRFQGQDISSSSIYDLTDHIGYVYQTPEHQFVTESVWEECIFGLRMQRPKRLQSRPLPQEVIDKGDEMLRRIGLFEQRDKHPYQLSTGEKRLLSVASMLITEPKLLILDEPTANQDDINSTKLLQFCADLTKQEIAVLMITHDPGIAAPFVTKSLVLA